MTYPASGYQMVCNASDNSVAVFDTLPGAPRRTIIAMSCSRSDESIITDLRVLQSAGHLVVSCHAGPELLERWEREGYRLLVDPLLTPTLRIVGVDAEIDHAGRYSQAQQDALSA